MNTSDISRNQVKNNYFGIVQARASSHRLPEKMLLGFGEETVLEFLLKRLQHSAYVRQWVVATSTSEDDDQICEIAEKMGVRTFRGSLADVLDRLYQCARAFDVEHIVRVGGDNPLLDPRIIDETIEAYERDTKGWDYFSNHHPPSFPDGQEVEIFTFASLQTSWEKAKQPYEREHGTPFLWDQPDVFRVGNYSRPGENLYYKHRWTLDYQEDYDLLSAIVSAFSGAYDFSQEQIVEFLDQHPEIYAINLSRHGQTWHANEKDHLRTAEQYRQLFDKSFAMEISQRKRRICCITGSRAEYSRLKPILAALKENDQVELQIVCTGTHILERYGNSIQDVINDGFQTAATCFMLVEGETPTTMSKSIGLAIIEFSTILANLNPDVLLVMGDRFEALASAVTGASMNVPLAHVQGGEISGSVDESFRHAITKLSHLHFPSTELSRQRIIMMGEDPDMVFNVGCPAVDSLLGTDLLSKQDLLDHPLLTPKRENRQRCLPEEGYVLCLLHPVTTEYEKVAQETMELALALDELGENVFWVWPNADPGARKIVRAIDHFVSKNGNDRFDFFDHIPMDVFISLMAHAKLMVGNSSAGIREACYFGVPVVNVGTRQSFRERAPNVADVPQAEKAKLLAVMKEQLKRGRYPVYKAYGDGDSGRRIAEILASIDIKLVQKHFYDNFTLAATSAGTGKVSV